MLAPVLLSLAAIVWAVGGVGLAAQAKAADQAAAGRFLYAKSGCAVCHGSAGKGDGPAAAALNPKPQDLSNGTRMKAMTDDFLFLIIKSGGGAVKRSAAMPPAPRSMTDGDIHSLVAYIRSLDEKSQ